jgi:hypothetical protein
VLPAFNGVFIACSPALGVQIYLKN